MNPILNSIKLIKRGEWINVLMIVLFTLFSAVIETLSVVSIVPFVEIVTKGGNSTNQIVLVLANFLESNSKEELIYASCGVLVLIYLVKAITNVFLSIIQNTFLFEKQNRLAKEIFGIYLHTKYQYFHNLNTSIIQKNVVSIVAWVIQNTLFPLLNLFSELAVFTFIVCILFWSDPVSASVLLIFFAVVLGLFFRRFKSEIDCAGKAQNEFVSKQIQCVSETFGAIKEIKVLNRQVFFEEQFSTYSKMYSEAVKKYCIITQLPRTVIELCAIVGLASMVLSIVIIQKDMELVLPTLSLFAMAAFRLMPSMTRITAFLNSIRFYAHNVNEIVILLDSTIHSDEDKSTIEEELGEFLSLTMKGVDFKYDNCESAIFTSLNFGIEKGDSVGIIGTSGAGKTTLVDLILGLYTPLNGVIHVNGIPLSDVKNSWRKKVGYIPQNIFLMDASIMSNVALGISDKDVDLDALDRALEIAQIREFVQSLPEGIHTRVGEHGMRMSGGQRQRIGIARAIYHDPELIIMDEATSSLDSDTERAFSDAVSKLMGIKTLLIVAHRLTTIKECSRVVRVNGGGIEELSKNLNT